MAVVHGPESVPSGDSAGLTAHLAHLAKLRAELAVAAARSMAVSLGVAIGVAVGAAIVSGGALVVLIVAGFAPLFGSGWQHLALAGGGVLALAALAIAWSVWRVRRLGMPRETVRSVMENGEWLVAQVRSRLRLR